MNRAVAEMRWFVVVMCEASSAMSHAKADVVNFQDLGPGLKTYAGPGGGNYWNGPASNATSQPDPVMGGTQTVGTFQSGNVSFSNSYNATYGSWGGFAYSDCTDTTTPGYTNQYYAYAGSGYGGSGNYAIGYGYVDGLDPTDPTQLDQLPSLTLPANARIQSAYVTNTTYAALSMLNGDRFAKKFGTGTDPYDWFALTVYGTDANNVLLSSSVTFFLADYRQLNGTPDYIVSQWTALDLSSLAGATHLYFNLASSDTGDFGMNTPACFAMDNIRYTIDGVWVGASGTWANAGNWQGGSVPGGTGDTATFGTSVGSAAATVTLSSSCSLSGLSFSTTGGGSYTIAGTDSLTLDNGSAAVSMSVSGGKHTIAVPVALASNLAVSVTSGSSLTIAGPISETNPGETVVLSGGGLLVLSGSNTYTGGTTVSGGTLEFASPAAVPTTGILIVGRSGSADLTGLLSFYAPSTLDTSIDHTSLGALSSDTSAGLWVPDQAVNSGSGEASLPDTGSIGGSVTTASVPEPSSFVLLGVGTLGLLGYAWRWRGGRRHEGVGRCATSGYDSNIG